MTQDTLPPIRAVAILGCGLIGASWAALCLAHGHDVTGRRAPSASDWDLLRRLADHCITHYYPVSSSVVINS